MTSPLTFRRILITGLTGFVGPHLVRELFAHQPEAELWGLVRWRSSYHSLGELADRIRFVEGDLHDAASIQAAIERARPDGLVHLAGQSSVTASWSAPTETIQTNLLGTLAVLEALRLHASDCRAVLVGSSEEYGDVDPAELPVAEETLPHPLSPYAVSRIAADYLGYQFFRSWGLPLIRLRPFNHTGPGQDEQFALPSFCRQVARIALGLAEPVVRVGDLEVQRDFLDVRDVARAYRLALELGEPGEVYVIASGRAVRLRKLLELIIETAGVTAEIVVDQGRLRPSDHRIIWGDSNRFRERTGWRPERTLENALGDLYRECLERERRVASR